MCLCISGSWVVDLCICLPTKLFTDGGNLAICLSAYPLSVSWFCPFLSLTRRHSVLPLLWSSKSIRTSSASPKKGKCIIIHLHSKSLHLLDSGWPRDCPWYQFLRACVMETPCIQPVACSSQVQLCSTWISRKRRDLLLKVLRGSRKTGFVPPRDAWKRPGPRLLRSTAWDVAGQPAALGRTHPQLQASQGVRVRRSHPVHPAEAGRRTHGDRSPHRGWKAHRGTEQSEDGTPHPIRNSMGWGHYRVDPTLWRYPASHGAMTSKSICNQRFRTLLRSHMGF